MDSLQPAGVLTEKYHNELRLTEQCFIGCSHVHEYQ
ncbi:hypothetical protein ACFDR8_002881 [Arthrobacter sp. MP_2.3]